MCLQEASFLIVDSHILATYKSEMYKCRVNYSISLKVVVLHGKPMVEQAAAVVSACLSGTSNSYYLKTVYPFKKEK